jgi:folate-dependent phosphoribosylglycinamide formyltransferase PurN
MKVLILTSGSLRHKFFISTIQKYFDLIGVLVEDKGKYYSEQSDNSKLVKNHFKKLLETEKNFFLENLGEFNLDGIKTKKINKGEVNKKHALDWAKKLKPDAIFLFGTSILNDEWLNHYKDKIVNLHLGLSPFYKGSATLFWPFVNGELECVGATIHLATKKVDSGGIIARIKPDINEKDNFYTVNYKTIKEAIEFFPLATKQYFSGNRELILKNVEDGKLYKKKDFNELVLGQVIDQYGCFIPNSTINEIKYTKKCIYCQ